MKKCAKWLVATRVLLLVVALFAASAVKGEKLKCIAFSFEGAVSMQKLQKADSVERRTLMITDNDGHTIDFVLEYNTRIGSLGAFFEILSGGEAYYFKVDEVKQISYGKKLVPTGVESPLEKCNGSRPFSLTNDGELFFSNLKKGTEVVVYNLEGRQIISYRAKNNAPYTLSLNGFKTGVYIVCIDNKTYKIQK